MAGMNPGFLSVLFCVLLSSANGLAGELQLTLLTFNAEGGGLNAGKPIDETVAVLRAADADIVGLQEMRALAPTCWRGQCPPVGPSVAVQLADEMGMHLYEQRENPRITWANAVLSRFPLVRGTPNDTGVIIDVDGRRVAVFNIHLDDYPYQPFQLLGIPYDGQPRLETAEQAVRAAQETRGEALRLLLEDLVSARDTDAQAIFGDFNEPSHLDWTERAAAAGVHPLAVGFPFSRALEAQGFVDALRAVYPDEVAKPAYTWTPNAPADDPAVHHDRIDFILVRGRGLTVESVAVVGEKSPEADLVVAPWPSDHRAVRAVIRLD
jgi:endonuclease/exonuclease/phosphatase family metal-dependent hydrolase